MHDGRPLIHHHRKLDARMETQPPARNPSGKRVGGSAPMTEAERLERVLTARMRPTGGQVRDKAAARRARDARRRNRK